MNTINNYAAPILRQNFPNGHKDFISLCLEEMALHSAKNADYARGGDPLGNFKRVSEMLSLWGISCPPYTVALIYLMKQMDAVGRMFGQDYEGDVEGVEDRLRDISIYSKLAQILYKESRVDYSRIT